MGSQESTVSRRRTNVLQNYDIGSRVEEVENTESENEAENDEYLIFHTSGIIPPRRQFNTLRPIVERNRLLREQNRVLKKIIRAIQDRFNDSTILILVIGIVMLLIIVIYILDVNS